MRRTTQPRRRGAEAPGTDAKRQTSRRRDAETPGSDVRRKTSPAPRRPGVKGNSDPFALFKKWFRAAEKAGESLPEAMALATATRDGHPSARVVLNRGVSRGGFVFFTNYNSRKAADLAGNPRAAIVFHWPTLERQVRIEGRARKLTRRESDAYFQTRPRESRLSAWASPQSATIPGRSFLADEFARAQARFGDGRIPCPPFWGGYRIVADCIEFWQGQPHRLHDRVVYRRKRNTWKILRLAP